ncbi:MAG: acyl--CoA ligase [Desulfobacteraceae bacterium]|nr:acyl--CoA ligase [Desulfobacteraceae bacterium]
MILASGATIAQYMASGVYSDLTLMDHLAVHVEKNPDKICIADPPNRRQLDGIDPERLSYGKFQSAIDATACGLVNLGLEKDDVVMVQLPNTWELAMLYFAISKAGGIISPAPVLWREAELKYIADLTEAKFFITLDTFNKFNHLKMGKNLSDNHPHLIHLLNLEDIRRMSRGPTDTSLEQIQVDANDIFTICWTSGTEANPKGCPLSHNNWAGMAAVQDAAGMKACDVMLTAGPLVNMASVGTVFIPWTVLGGTLILHHPFDPDAFMHQIMTEKPNYTLLVPALANMLAKHPSVDKFDLSSFRTITLGSAPPSLWTMQEFKKRWDIDIGNIWGQNEGTGFISSIKDVPDMKTRATCFPHYGKKGVKWKSLISQHIIVKLVDPMDRQVTKIGEVGELVYKGPGVIAEYYKAPDITKKSFTQDGFFRTGDIFKIVENNCICFYERAKDIIIRGGYNISSQEIENHLMAHPKIQDLAVVSMPDEKLGEKMCVYAVPAPDKQLDLDDLTCFLEEKKVARYKHPERLEIVDAIPRNPVGKVLKKKLRQNILSKLAME